MNEALWKIEDIYLESGWDVASPKQEAFDREVFVEKRRVYIKEIVRPLEEEHENWDPGHTEL